ncbi:MAG TPA: hypothetical protein VGM13_12760 [Thermoanaerobaculia bacterium]|jgi:hypothetical protein
MPFDTPDRIPAVVDGNLRGLPRDPDAKPVLLFRTREGVVEIWTDFLEQLIDRFPHLSTRDVRHELHKLDQSHMLKNDIASIGLPNLIFRWFECATNSAEKYGQSLLNGSDGDMEGSLGQDLEGGDYEDDLADPWRPMLVSLPPGGAR